MKINLHKLIITVLTIFAFAGCKKTPETEQTQTSPLSSDHRTSVMVGDAEKILNLFCWSEYVPQTVIDAFTKETGIKVSVENYTSNEEMLAALLTGNSTYDLIQPSEYITEALIKEDLLLPLDHAAIPNLSNIAPEFLNMPFDPGNKYTIPYLAGSTGIVVNTELIKEEIKGFNDVFQEKYNKNIVVLDDTREIVSWGLLSLGIPVNDVSDKNLEKVRPVLTKWLPLVKIFDSNSPKTALLNEDVALGVIWGGEAAVLLNKDKKFKWVVPAEGAYLFVDNLAIPENAEHVKNAYLFMNFILRPEISKMISDEFPYLNPNQAAYALLSPEQRNNPASFPSKEDLLKMQIFKDIGAQTIKVDQLVLSLQTQ